MEKEEMQEEQGPETDRPGSSDLTEAQSETQV